MKDAYKRAFTFLLIGVTVLLLGATYRAVVAGCCQTYSPFAGSTAYAAKNNITITIYVWRAEIMSGMGSYQGGGPAIDEIGWTFWHVYEECDGAVWEYKELSAQSRRDTNWAYDLHQQGFSCSGSSQYTGNRGNHVFKEGGQVINMAPEYRKQFP